MTHLSKCNVSSEEEEEEEEIKDGADEMVKICSITSQYQNIDIALVPSVLITIIKL